ncbi:hypothetical protein ACFWDI_02075 [Streptomyces sp. NPDC060064]|uniref:hypothetical protein n=1 Tax=Streptomyces sp. NPDC060064 TaxID=3347049 RepID=UPI003682A127
MFDTTELTAVVDRFADRLRAAPQSRLQRGAAAEGLALARELALRAQRIEAQDRAPRIMPDAGPFAVADQLMVAGRDLAEALRAAPSGSLEEVDEAVSLVRAAMGRAGL